MFYTGVGSRSTPADVLQRMYQQAVILADLGLRLRSGGADGADSAFEKGANGLADIFLPWPGFNGGNSPFQYPSDAAVEMASKYHPAWDRCSRGAKLLHARNCHQVLGPDLDTPSEFLICWTPGGKDVGGTRTAIVIARDHGVRVHNLGG